MRQGHIVAVEGTWQGIWITVKIKLQPTKEQLCLLASTMKGYIRLVNQAVSDFMEADAYLGYMNKTVVAYTRPTGIELGLQILFPELWQTLTVCQPRQLHALA